MFNFTGLNYMVGRVWMDNNMEWYITIVQCFTSLKKLDNGSDSYYRKD